MSRHKQRLSEKDRRRVAVFADQYAGIQLPPRKHNLIETRLNKRQRALGFDSLSAYIDYALNLKHEEHVLLIDALTTNKTEFFREAEHFRVLLEHLHNQRSQEFSPERPLRCWSAGCSSGQEAYTIAMVLREMPLEHFSVWATDISVSVLEEARRAVYPHNEAEPIDLSMRKKYLLRSRSRTPDLVKIAPAIRRHVRFTEFNLVSGNYKKLRPFDVIFCRNVMIYFDTFQRRTIIEHFYDTLKPGGLLFLGHSESISSDQEVFRQVVPTVYEKL